MKPTVDDILKIRPGKAKTFILATPSECHSLRSLIGYVKRVRKPSDVSDYSTSTDWDTNSVTVMAK